MIHTSIIDFLRAIMQQQGSVLCDHLLKKYNMVSKFMEYIQNGRHTFEYDIKLINRKTKKSTGLGYASFFLQFLVELKSMSEMDKEIDDILHKQADWESFKTKFMQHQIDQEESKNGNLQSNQ